MQDHGIQECYTLKLARNQETHREVVEGLQLIHREQYDFFSYIIPG